MRLIDADALRETMYHKAFETDTDMQKWDSGCWIRYKMFENALENAPTIETEPIRHGRWIVDAEDWRHQIEWFKCSLCDFPTSTAYKYCPYCGALMEAKDEDAN